MLTSIPMGDSHRSYTVFSVKCDAYEKKQLGMCQLMMTENLEKDSDLRFVELVLVLAPAASQSVTPVTMVVKIILILMKKIV